MLQRPPPPFRPRYASIELRGGLHFLGCDCVRRNGLQDDCPRWDCAGRPECDVDPWPKCYPQQTTDFYGKRKPNFKTVSALPIHDKDGFTTVPYNYQGQVYCCCDSNK